VLGVLVVCAVADLVEERTESVGTERCEGLECTDPGRGGQGATNEGGKEGFRFGHPEATRQDGGFQQHRIRCIPEEFGEVRLQGLCGDFRTSREDHRTPEPRDAVPTGVGGPGLEGCEGVDPDGLRERGGAGKRHKSRGGFGGSDAEASVDDATGEGGFREAGSFDEGQVVKCGCDGDVVDGARGLGADNLVRVIEEAVDLGTLQSAECDHDGETDGRARVLGELQEAGGVRAPQQAVDGGMADEGILVGVRREESDQCWNRIGTLDRSQGEGGVATDGGVGIAGGAFEG
jgi:hypothetical protein